MQSMALVLGGVLAAAACGSPSSADPRQAAEELAVALCDLSFRCCTAGEVGYHLGHYVTEDDCAERLITAASLQPAVTLQLPMLESVGLVLPNLSVLDQAVADGRTVVDSEQVAACLDFLQSYECSAMVDEPAMCVRSDLEAPGHPCDPRLLFDGNLGGGQRCSSVGSSFECRPGLTCRALSGFGTDGVCVGLGQEGDFCFADGECGSDLYCSQLDGTCRLLGQVGDVCSYADPDDPSPSPDSVVIRCAPGLSCDPVSDQCALPCERGAACSADVQCDAEAGLICVQGRCDLPRGPGMLCSTDRHCEPGLLCQLADDDSGDRVCSEPGAIDAPCAAHGDCASGFCEPATRLCAAAAAPGETCPSYQHAACDGGFCADTNAFDGTPTCAGDAECADGSGLCDLDRGECVPVCAALRADGQSCDPGADHQCRSGGCVNGACRALPLENGQECELSSQCGSEFCGYEGTCEALPLADGRPCARGLECESGVCFDDQCAPGLAEGEACGASGQPPCGRDLYCDAQAGAPVCARLLGTGEACDSSAQCRGLCVERFGRLVCDATPPAGAAVCDGGDV